MTAAETAGARPRKPWNLGRILLYTFISLSALLWMVPLFGALLSSFRPFAETVRDGAFSWPHTLTLENYQNAWTQGDIPRKYLNTAIILIPALLLTLFFSSMVAFVCSRFSWKFNVLLLSLFAAGTLNTDQQIINDLEEVGVVLEVPEAERTAVRAQTQDFQQLAGDEMLDRFLNVVQPIAILA